MNGIPTEQNASAPLRHQVSRLHYQMDRRFIARIDRPAPGWHAAAALYLHAVCVEDGLINTLVGGAPPLFTAESSWILSLTAWHDHHSTLRRYVHATRVITDVYLAGVTRDELNRSLALPSQSPAVPVTVSWILNDLFLPFLARVRDALATD